MLTETPVQDHAPLASTSLPSPYEALWRLHNAISPVGTERVDASLASGRVLAEDVRLDRDSPAADVSAMDGFALCHGDLQEKMHITGAVPAGTAPFALVPGSAVRIFTGSLIPANADTVVRKEWVREHDGFITITRPLEDIARGSHIRKQGENAQRGDVVLQPGLLHPAKLASLSMAGVSKPVVRERVRVAVLSTGTEIVAASAVPEMWQTRDGNGPAACAFARSRPWLELVACEHIKDERDSVVEAIERMLAQADMLIISGAVSVGDHDHVPGALSQLGAQTLYHGLCMRPGKPGLGAVTDDNKAVICTPGNPVSALVALRLFADAAARAFVGLPAAACPRVEVTEAADHKPIGLYHYQPAVVNADGTCTIVRTKGSGDIIAAAQADGVVEVPPHEDPSNAPRRFFPWEMSV